MYCLAPKTVVFGNDVTAADTAANFYSHCWLVLTEKRCTKILKQFNGAT